MLITTLFNYKTLVELRKKRTEKYKNIISERCLEEMIFGYVVHRTETRSAHWND